MKALAYKCHTCQIDLSAAICLNCFRDGDHKGHDCNFGFLIFLKFRNVTIVNFFFKKKIQ